MLSAVSITVTFTLTKDSQGILKVGPDRIASHFRCHGTFQESGWLSVTCFNVSSKHTAKKHIIPLDIKVYHLPHTCAFETPPRLHLYPFLATSKVAPLQAIMANGATQIQLHSFLTTIGAWRWSASRSGRFVLGKKSPRCPLKKRLDEPLSRSRRFGKEKISLPVENRTKNRSLRNAYRWQTTLVAWKRKLIPLTRRLCLPRHSTLN